MVPPRFALIPAVYILLLREAPGAGPASKGGPASSPQVLLQLRRGTGFMDGYWASGAAGHVEAGESVVAAAVREAREELGIDVGAAGLEPLTGMHRSNDVGGAALEQRVDFFFAARSWTGEPRIMEGTRCAGLRWFALADLPEPVPPHERVVLERLAAALDGGPPVPAILPFGFDGERIERCAVARPR
ncbi:NUDIX hydrolase [Actinomyces gaoshouyii]|uniref:NUDIX hydrolase n=1 Tax=Actinomyces gaoshouyii TaxID=1960083 RepID=UPI0009BD1903|nr:NUDIX domain-containing protein [Actinomyces gaoshouyii]ARD42662.1 NUDIX hydrolase [Actinomyces gaoshouyii]